MKTSQLEQTFVSSLWHGISKKEAVELKKLAALRSDPVAVLDALVARYATTPKQIAQARKALGLAANVVPMQPKVSVKRHNELVKAYKALLPNLGEPVKAMSRSLVTVRDVLIKSMGRCGGTTVTALIPVANRTPPKEMADPNEVDAFYIETRAAGVRPDLATKIYGPFKLSEVLGQRGTGSVSVHGIDNGRTIELSKGETLTVALAENAGSTGARWVVNPVDRSFGDATSQDYLPGMRPRMIGGGTGGGTRVFTWNTQGNGFIHAGETYPVQLQLMRGSTALDTFKIDVKIV